MPGLTWCSENRPRTCLFVFGPVSPGLAPVVYSDRLGSFDCASRILLRALGWPFSYKLYRVHIAPCPCVVLIYAFMFVCVYSVKGNIHCRDDQIHTVYSTRTNAKHSFTSILNAPALQWKMSHARKYKLLFISCTAPLPQKDAARQHFGDDVGGSSSWLVGAICVSGTDCVECFMLDECSLYQIFEQYGKCSWNRRHIFQ